MLLINTNNFYHAFSLVFSKHKFPLSAASPPPPKSSFSQASDSITKNKLKLPLVSLTKSLPNTQFDLIQSEKMVNFMMDKYIVPSFVVSLLGFLLLYVLRPRTPNYKKMDLKSTRKCETHNVISRKLEKGTDADVIIVGAGVAGAALAHTLAKVYSQLLSNLRFSYF